MTTVNAADVINVARTVAARVPPRDEEFHAALRQRTPWALVTPAIIAVNVLVFFAMAFTASGPIADPKTLVEWGGNFGPKTTNGEWWRLAASMFLHPGFFHLLINIGAFAPASLMLERLVGRLAVATTYLTAGILASLVNVAEEPMGTFAGSAAAIFGIYGLLAAAFAMGIVRRSAWPIPPPALVRLAPIAFLFILYQGIGAPAHLTGLIMGFACGMVLTPGMSLHKPPRRRVATIAVAAAIAGVVTAVPIHGIADVRPEIVKIEAIEARTAADYEVMIDRFRKGRIQPAALATHIEQKILPDLTAARARLLAFHGVPLQHRPMVAAAGEYLRLRQESFQVRVDALRTANLKKLQEAERLDIDALKALATIPPPDKR